eukprot:6026420-Pyramimonas_sp.AAC.1
MQTFHLAFQKDIPYCRVKNTYAQGYANIEIKMHRQAAAWPAWEHAETIFTNQGGIMEHGI